MARALLDCLIETESAYDSNAVSSANCKGLTQLSDATGAEIFKRMRLHGVYDPFNPFQNMIIGAAFLIELLSKYGGYDATCLALAAYNRGEPGVDTAIKKAGSRLWADIKSELPQETQEYPGKILGLYRRG